MARRLWWLGIVSPMQMARRRAVRYGFVGGERLWRFIGLTMVIRELLRRIFGRRPEYVALERLAPGQSVQVTAIPSARSSRRRRRRR